MSDVPRETAIQELRSIVMEAQAYAKMHDINFLACTDNTDDSFRLVHQCSPEAMGQFWYRLGGMVPPYVIQMLIDADNEAELDDDQQPEPQAPPRPKWSILWGLFTRYE